MDIPISYPGFEGRGLLLKDSFVSGTSLWMDGARVNKVNKSYLLRDNQGRSIEVKLKRAGLDPLPRLQIAGDLVRLAEPLKVHEYIWAALPLVLLIGGAIGGGLGGAAAFLNLRVFRTDCAYALKYVITAAISGAALVTFLVLAALIAMLLGRA
jgi:hypothetical protein